jgi:hypothetical protein
MAKAGSTNLVDVVNYTSKTIAETTSACTCCWHATTESLECDHKSISKNGSPEFEAGFWSASERD